MNFKKIFFLLFAISISLTILDSCKGKSSSGSSTLNVHFTADPDMLHPLNKTTVNAQRTVDLLFSSLEGLNPTGNFEQVPYLLKEIPKITEITDGENKGGMKLEFEIKEDAVWDNGTPITGHDYVFTLKAILNPKTNCEPLKGYYDWLADVVIDSANPKKFTVYSSMKYFKIEEFATGYVIPEYNYDPNKIMRKFTIKDMNTAAKRTALKTNSDIVKSATDFNSEKYQRDPKFVVGSGPYALDHWTTGQELVLKRKENWWGDKYKDQRTFWAFPKKIRIRIINDNNTALTALKDGQIDNFFAIPAKDFKELEGNSSFKEKYALEKQDRLMYAYIGMNLRNPKFQDLKVRKALAHAIDRDKINKVIAFGESKKTESFVHVTQPHYNKNITPFEFDLTKANQLLDEAGWKDTDGDGIRDKVINGRKTPFTLEFKYFKDETVKNQILIIQEDIKKLGIDFKMVEKEWTVYVQDLDKHQFEMYTIGFSISPTMTDPKQQWHTSSSVPGGSNNVGWGDALSDKMIEAIDAELDLSKRTQLYMQLQQKIHDEVPVIFMFNSINRIATNKKFSVEKVLITPGVMYNEFKIN